MTTQLKQLIRTGIESAIDQYGSAAKVATKVGLNGAYISMMRNAKGDETLKDEHWAQVAKILGVNMTGWQTVDIINTRIIRQVLTDAQDKCMFFAISHPAGSGKTAAARDYQAANAARECYYYHVPHGETNKVDFLRSLAQSLGIDTKGSGYLSANRLAELVIEFFTKRLDRRPLLIVDEADKLTDKAMRFFIALYNAVEGQMGCCILGTDNLEKTVKNGVNRQRNGFDEIDSRFGRRFIHLVGISKREAAAICAANGITNAQTQAELFQECEPVRIQGAKQSMEVLKDLRRLKRCIEREQFNLQSSAPVEAATV